MLGGGLPETENKRIYEYMWSLTRELFEQYLTKKQNGYLQSGRLLEVVAKKELTVASSKNMPS